MVAADRRRDTIVQAVLRLMVRKLSKQASVLRQLRAGQHGLAACFAYPTTADHTQQPGSGCVSSAGLRANGCALTLLTLVFNAPRQCTPPVTGPTARICPAFVLSNMFVSNPVCGSDQAKSFSFAPTC